MKICWKCYRHKFPRKLRTYNPKGDIVVSHEYLKGRDEDLIRQGDCKVNKLWAPGLRFRLHGSIG